MRATAENDVSASRRRTTVGLPVRDAFSMVAVDAHQLLVSAHAIAYLAETALVAATVKLAGIETSATWPLHAGQ